MNTLPKLTCSLAALLLSASLSYASTYSQTVLADQPSDYWRLNESTVGTVTDLTGNGNGTHSAGFTSAQLGKLGAIRGDSDTSTAFNGSNTWIEGTLQAIPFTGSWTIEMWFNQTAISEWSGLFSNNNNAVDAPLATMNANTNLFGINDSGTTAENISVDLGPTHFGKWLYGAITYNQVMTNDGNVDQAASTVSVYVFGNGEDPLSLTPQSASGSSNLVWINDDVNRSSSGFYIGRHWTVVTQIWNGQLDEMALYNYALSEQQLADHYEVGTAVPEPNSAGLALLGGGAALGLLRRRRA